METLTPHVDVQKSRLNSWIPAALWLLAAFSFWLLDTQAVFTGDDLGYMFTDSKLHNLDGHRADSLSDIFTTQASHWHTVNGRYILHCLVMLFASILGKTWFCIVNAAIFGFLAVMASRLILPRHLRTPGCSLAVLILLWLCLPRPGVIMLSLIAYAVNYLWTGAAMLGILLLWRLIRRRQLSSGAFYLATIAAVPAAALQESFSIPLSAGFLIWWIVNRCKTSARERIFMLCFFAGTAVLFLAPGNYARTAAGGGLSATALLAKSSALATDLFFSSINLLAVTVVLIPLLFRSRIPLLRDNIILLTAITVSLLFASLTYTAERQLFAPSLFATIVLGRIIFSLPDISILSSALATAGMTIAYAGMIFGAYEIRRPASDAYQQIISQARQGNKIITIPTPQADESHLFNLLFDRFNDDPAQNRELKYLFDSYTKNGLSRLYSPAKKPGQISTFLPASSDSICAAAAKARHRGNIIDPAPLTDYFTTFAIPASSGGKTHWKASRSDGKRLHYERVLRNDSLYYVVPSEAGQIKLTQK